jgi:hypothetical protein
LETDIACDSVYLLLLTVFHVRNGAMIDLQGRVQPWFNESLDDEVKMSMYNDHREKPNQEQVPMRWWVSNENLAVDGVYIRMS